ncbi:SgcJ/EcaC family oxidoreductase [Nocardia inohanensis]|uniref:SgcJ/EcaC family oxidoreductase n=1 Tax=Nocardia inohanensis TaxID=209246 RepID=UPI0008307AD6|nr:SgcJ/EcaC family oxidoreductase [Nocardia inohanensis]
MSDTAVRTDREAVLTVLSDLYRAWTANDADAFVADYDPEATSILRGVVNNGADATRAHMAAGFAGPLRGSTTIDEPQSVRFPAPGTAVVVSRSAVVMAGETEPPADRWVLATWTLVRREGRWLITAYHNCPAQ